MTQIVIVEDHPVVREGIKQILADQKEFSVVAEAGDGEQAIRVLESTPCDLVLLDISLPKIDGLQVLKWLKTKMPSIPVLVLSVHSEDEWAPQMLRAGASGYLMKDSLPENLIHAVHSVARRGRYVSPTLAEKIAMGTLERINQPAAELLSAREYQILSLLSSGKTVTQIARDLEISVKTVSTYRGRILDKLSLHNNAELMRYAFKQQLSPESADVL